MDDQLQPWTDNSIYALVRKGYLREFGKIDFCDNDASVLLQKEDRYDSFSYFILLPNKQQEQPAFEYFVSRPHKIFDHRYKHG